MSVSDTLRQALSNSAESIYAISKESRISYNVLKRFVAGGGLRSEHIDKLSEYLEMQLTAIPKAPKKTKGK